MYRFLLTPRWIAGHVLLVAAVAVCAILGSWQADAFRESKTRHDARDRAAAPLADLVPPGTDSVGEAADRAVVVRGEFEPAAQVLVPGRVHQDTLGSYVVTLLQADGGVVVPVLRGWLDDPDDAGASAPTGAVEVTGHLLPPETEAKAVTRSDRPLESHQISHITPALIAGTIPGVDEDSLLPGFVIAETESPAPVRTPVRLSADDVDPIRDVSPWQNASYWAQWWVFGLAAVVFWASAVRAAVRNRRRTSVTEPDRAPQPS